MSDLELRQAVIDSACRMHKDGLTVANSGNVSVRCGEAGLLITPSGIAYEQLEPEDIVLLDLSGNVLSGTRSPSSEWRFHCDIYHHRPDANAIVHAHSPAATALSILRKPIPAFHYMVALMGGNEIPCADYATFGTQALSDHVMSALEGYQACLMANHGMLAIGTTMDKAYNRALELESLCYQYSLALQCGEPVMLTDEQMLAAKQAFSGYGQ